MVHAEAQRYSIGCIKIMLAAFKFMANILKIENGFKMDHIQAQHKGLLREATDGKKFIAKAYPLNKDWLTILYKKYVEKDYPNIKGGGAF